MILGTVQFGQNYGIANFSNKSDKKNIFKIFEYAISKGVCHFDTAPSYKTENLIGEFIKTNKLQKIVKISSKIPSLKFCKNKKFFILNSIENSIKKSNTYIDNFFFHDQKDINFFLNNLDFIEDIKKKFFIKKIGVSLYNLPKSKKFLSLRSKILLQLPVNIANFKKNTVEKTNHEIYARSVFLQGLLLNKKIKKNLVKKKLVYSHETYLNYLKEKKISALQLNLSFIHSLNRISKIIIGVNNIQQLKQILNTSLCNYNKKIYSEIYKIFYIKSIDPRKWKK